LLDRLKVTITRSLKSINQVRSGEKSHHKFPAVNEIYGACNGVAMAI